MCDVNGPFKLCTCSKGVNRNKPHWVLHKGLDEEKRTWVIGQFSEPSIIEPIVRKKLLRRINSVNVFDFEYIPEERDLLKLFDGRDTYYLRFTNNKWKWVDEEDYLGYLDKFGDKKKGCLEGSKSELRILIDKIENSSSSRSTYYRNNDRFITREVFDKLRDRENITEEELTKILQEEVERIQRK